MSDSWKYKEPEFIIWLGMIRRCYDVKNASYHRYGGRGIIVCERWLTSFYYFYEDMGRRPSSSHSIDRINNDGDYEPSNCRWATPKEQARNKSSNKKVIVNGTKMTIAELSEQTGINFSTLSHRLRVGYLLDNLSSPPSTRIKYEYNGIMYSINQLSCMSGVPSGTLHKRLTKNKMTVEQAMDTNYLTERRAKGIIVDRHKTEYQGEILTLRQISHKTGILYFTLRDRYRKGLRGEHLVKAVHSLPKVEYNGNQYSILELSKEVNITVRTLLRRIFKEKMSVHEAILKPLRSRYDIKNNR